MACARPGHRTDPASPIRHRRRETTPSPVRRRLRNQLQFQATRRGSGNQYLRCAPRHSRARLRAGQFPPHLVGLHDPRPRRRNRSGSSPAEGRIQTSQALNLQPSHHTGQGSNTQQRRTSGHDASAAVNWGDCRRPAVVHGRQGPADHRGRGAPVVLAAPTYHVRRTTVY
jgi:hypothetical protein